MDFTETETIMLLLFSSTPKASHCKYKAFKICTLKWTKTHTKYYNDIVVYILDIII